ncbi:MAG: hypothetical protein WCZ72_12220 [Gemmobacter sp.]
MRKHLLCLCACVTLLAPPLAAQTVELSTRTFWIGERPDTLESQRPFITLRRIAWIEAILGTDPVLRDAMVQIEETGMSAAAIVARAPSTRDIRLGPDRLPPQFDLPGYRIYGLPVTIPRGLTYVPTDPGAGFHVRCGRQRDVERILVCTIFARYAPDDRISLIARLYFPPDPADRPTYFRDVVERMREVAHCLDVTDELVEVPAIRPELKGCRLEPIS